MHVILWYYAITVFSSESDDDAKNTFIRLEGSQALSLKIRTHFWYSGSNPPNTAMDLCYWLQDEKFVMGVWVSLSLSLSLWVFERQIIRQAEARVHVACFLFTVFCYYAVAHSCEQKCMCIGSMERVYRWALALAECNCGGIRHRHRRNRGGPVHAALHYSIERAGPYRTRWKRDNMNN